ncbi:MAG: hypothetical protein ACI9PP_000257 [Halobacteriales archaeon]|jgi:hypothetical protein
MVEVGISAVPWDRARPQIRQVLDAIPASIGRDGVRD